MSIFKFNNNSQVFIGYNSYVNNILYAVILLCIFNYNYYTYFLNITTPLITHWEKINLYRVHTAQQLLKCIWGHSSTTGPLQIEGKGYLHQTTPYIITTSFLDFNASMFAQLNSFQEPILKIIVRNLKILNITIVNLKVFRSLNKIIRVVFFVINI